MSYSKMTQHQLWTALRRIDMQIIEAGRPKPQFLIDDDDDGDSYQENLELGWHLDELRDTRKEIIQTFIDDWGYNPDNLCKSAEPVEDDEPESFGNDLANGLTY